MSDDDSDDCDCDCGSGGCFGCMVVILLVLFGFYGFRWWMGWLEAPKSAYSAVQRIGLARRDDAQLVRTIESVLGDNYLTQAEFDRITRLEAVRQIRDSIAPPAPQAEYEEDQP